MANVEKYLFEVDAETRSAAQKLNEISRLMNNIDKIATKAGDNYFTTTQKDMHKSMRSMAQITKHYHQLERELDNISRRLNEAAHSTQIPTDATKQQREEIEKLISVQKKQADAVLRQQEAIRAAYTRTQRVHQSLSNNRQNYSKDFKPVMSGMDVFKQFAQNGDIESLKTQINSLSENADNASNRLKNVKDQIREAQKLDRRSESLSRRAEASGYMSYQQATSFRADHRTATQQYVGAKETNLTELTKLMQERFERAEKVKQYEQNPTLSKEDWEEKIKQQDTIRQIDDEIKARQELNQTLHQVTKNMQQYSERVTAGDGIDVKPERGTFRGMMYERAPAIGLAMTGVIGATMGGLYMKGAQNDKAMRDDVIAVGQHTGMDGENWRSGVRDNALNAGLQDKLGFSGQEMLSFQQNYLSNNGFTNQDDLNTAMQNQAIFSRSTGIDSQATGEFFDAMFKTGAVNGNQVKDIQNGFIGAIKQSGMEGREKEQLKALQGIVSSVSQGRTITEQDTMNIMGMQSLLASTGIRSLTGEAGGNLMTGLDEGIRQGINNPKLRLLFGQGTKYQGLEGSYELRKRMEKGISDPELVKELIGAAASQSTTEGGQKEALARIAANELGVEMSTSQIDGIMDLYNSGKLNQETLSQVIAKDNEVGSEEAAKKFENYQNSDAATSNQSEATTEKQATQMYDFGDAIRSANTALAGVPAVAYATIVALGALAASVAGTAMSFGGSAFGRKALGKKMQDKGGGPDIGGNGYSGKGGRVRQTWENTKERVGGWFNRGGGGGGDNPKPPTGGGGGGKMPDLPEGGASGGGKGSWWKGALSKGGNILSKAALPITALVGLSSIISAPEGEKAKAAGSTAGGLFGGAMGGALAGSVFPGVGTIIGGLLGAFGGGAVGGKIGDWVGGWFGGGDKEAKPKEAPTNEQSVQTQTDKESTNTKSRTEAKRTDNITQEKENLSIYERLLNQAESILNQARMQNGIFGSAPTGGSMGTDGMYSGEFQQLNGGSNAEKIWNFFSEKGFDSTAIAGIMGNLQQESGLDPTAVNPSSGAFGVGQWLGARKTNLQNYAKENGMDVNSLDTQLNFLWKEMLGGDTTFKSVMGKYGGLDALKSANTKDATLWFEKAFERSGGSAMDKRYDYADGFYNQFKNTQTKVNAGTSGDPSKSGANNVKVQSTINVHVTGDEKVSEKVKDSKDMSRMSNDIQQKIYGSMNYHSRETGRA